MNRDVVTLPDISCRITQLPLLRVMKIARPKKAKFSLDSCFIEEITGSAVG
jgi:hypothetical protein